MVTQQWKHHLIPIMRLALKPCQDLVQSHRVAVIIEIFPGTDAAICGGVSCTHAIAPFDEQVAIKVAPRTTLPDDFAFLDPYDRMWVRQAGLGTPGGDCDFVSKLPATVPRLRVKAIQGFEHTVFHWTAHHQLAGVTHPAITVQLAHVIGPRQSTRRQDQTALVEHLPVDWNAELLLHLEADQLDQRHDPKKIMQRLQHHVKQQPPATTERLVLAENFALKSSRPHAERLTRLGLTC